MNHTLLNDSNVLFKLMNDFLFAINIRCEPDEYENLLKKANIEYFDFQIYHKKFYYDVQTYCVFDSLLNRQEFFEKFNKQPELKKNTNEITFCQRR